MELLQYRKARFEKNSLIIDENLSLEEWKDLGQSLRQVEGSVQFWIGDWARFGEKKGFTGKYVDSKVYDELEEVTGIDRRTIQDYKTVSERTSAVRHADLDYSHHREVASLPQDKQKHFLDQASEEKLSVRQLREEIKKADQKEESYNYNNFLKEQLREEKELKEIARGINEKYTKDQRKLFISFIKI